MALLSSKPFACAGRKRREQESSEKIMTEEVKAEKPKKEKKPREPKRGIGSVVEEAILAGKTTEQCIQAAKDEFPESKIKEASVNWYRNKLRKAGHDVPKHVRAPAKSQEQTADPLA